MAGVGPTAGEGEGAVGRVDGLVGRRKVGVRTLIVPAKGGVELGGVGVGVDGR